MRPALPLLPPSSAFPPTSVVIWEYRTGFGAPVLATRRRQPGARPRFGEVVELGGALWRVYDWIVGRTQFTLLVERLNH